MYWRIVWRGWMQVSLQVGRPSRLDGRHRGMEGAFPFQMDGEGGSCCWWPLPFLSPALPAPPPPLNLEPAFLLALLRST